MRVIQSRAMPLGCIWPLLAAWTLLALVSRYFSHAVLGEELDLIAVAILAALALFATFERLRFPDAVLEADHPPTAGATFQGTIGAPIALGLEPVAKVRLMVVRSQLRSRRALWEQELVVHPAPAEHGVQASFAFAIPPSLADKLGKECFWTLRFAARSGWYPYRASFSVGVGNGDAP